MAAPGPLTGYIPVLLYTLKQLERIIEKGETYANEKGIKHEDMLNYRMAPDMAALTYQLQACCNTIVWFIDRVGELEHVVIEDNEDTFERLYMRIAHTVSYVQNAKFDKDAFDAKAERPFVMKTAKAGDYAFDTTREYVLYFVLSNLHFHTATAYCLLRQQGVPLGALDYIGNKLEKVA
ncbi:hypothetical protein F5Y18DRAFT_145802 [Xylariaceae sp. FL1019]|nr:hypothetical protein F5Y18DRAFT_145802 [Xylariaceae sp. FL1019]